MHPNDEGQSARPSPAAKGHGPQGVNDPATAPSPPRAQAGTSSSPPARRANLPRSGPCTGSRDDHGHPPKPVRR